MAVMARYCKAYPLGRLRQFAGWTERPGSLAPKGPAQPEGSDAAPAEGEPEYLFLQENFVVTVGVFVDEDLVFDAVTPEWEAFCANELQFEVPAYEVKVPAPRPAEAKG